MAAIDVEALLAPVSDADPVGEDFDGSEARFAIEEPFGLDQGDGDVEGLDWRGTVNRIIVQSRETKDLWLATYLMRAGAKLGDLETVTGGATMLAGLLERYWDTVHPQLEMVDFIGRKSPLEALTKIRDFLGPLRRTVLVEHPRLGRFTGEDLERFALTGPDAEGYGMFRAALETIPLEDIRTAVDRLDAIRDAIRRSDAVLTANAAGDTSTNFQPTYEVVEALRRAVTPYAGLVSEPEVSDDAAPADHGGTFDSPVASGSAGAPRIGGRVDSREDVTKAIDAIIEYYQRREPSSPIPVLLSRARAWVHLDFFDLLNDFLPDSLTEARRVLMTKSDREASSGY